MNPPVSRKRLWLMRLAAVLLSLVPLIAAEVALRLVHRPVIEAQDPDPWIDLHHLRPLFERNDQTGRWEIPPQRYNFFRPDSFSANKPAGLRRIFVLGGSTVQGRPYAIETAFSTWLRLRLQAASPESEFEVVNCGGVSYASYRVARILDEVLQHQPDAVVIYTGHNEFLEDREYEDVREMSPFRRRMSQLASKIRLVSWIQQQLSSPSLAKTVLSGEVDARLDHPGGLDQYRRDPNWKSGVESHFADTLRTMIAAAQAADVPLILCVPAGDLVRTPPFKTVSRLEPGTPSAKRFDADWQRATDIDLPVEDRLAACDACIAQDPDHAGAHYVAGRLRYESGSLQAATQHLIHARDWDVCPLRATSPIVDAVRTLAAEFNVPLVDTERLLDQRDHEGAKRPDGIADPENFLDHVHPTINGHQQLGLAVFEEIGKLRWFSVSPESEKRYQDFAQQHLDALGEDYYARGKQRLQGLRRWAAGRAGQPWSEIDE